MIPVFLLFASMFLITSSYTFSPPANYTWPKNNKTLCFAGQFDLVLNVDYTQTTGAIATARIPLDKNTYESYIVSCPSLSNVHELTISMLDGLTDIIFSFSVDGDNMTSLEEVHGYITVNDKQGFFKNYSNLIEGVHKFWVNTSLFVADRGSSYRCNTKTTITGFNTTRNLTITSIELENLRIQSFVDDSKEFNNYGVEKVCPADINKDSNLIPIIVGACLAVLVVVVLVAYLIGRRRSRNGYQSV